MAIQFGIANLSFGGVSIGYLQGVTVDISYDVAKLYSGAGLFPISVRPHTGNVSGNAQFANLTAAAFEKVLGATRTGDTVAISNSSSPNTFQMVCTITTNAIPLVFTFKKVRATKLSIGFVRTDHAIPNFDFECEANATGEVATIDLGDVS